MKKIFGFVCLSLLLLPACRQAVETVKPSVERPSHAETTEVVDFAVLLREIKNCNLKELTYFEQHWDEIHSQLKLAVRNGTLVDLPMKQQEELWNELGFLQGCRHPDIMKVHGAEMVKILIRFGTQEQRSFLSEVPPGPKRDAE